MEIGHGIISTAILPLPLIQEVQLSITGERMKALVNRFNRSKLAHGKSVVRLTVRLDMTIAIDWDVKSQNNKNNNVISRKPKVHLIISQVVKYFFEM